MGNIRVKELALELNVDDFKILDALEKKGIRGLGTDRFARINDTTADEIRELFSVKSSSTMDDTNSTLLSKSQLEQLDEPERMKYLLKHWQLKKEEVNGTLFMSPTRSGEEEKIVDLWWLEGHKLDPQYPIEGSYIPVGRLFIGGKLKGFETGEYVRANFRLAKREERIKQANPLLISIDKQSLVPQHTIDQSEITKQEDGSIDINKTIFNDYLKKNEPNLAKTIDEQKSLLTELKESETNLIGQVSKIEQSITEKEDHSKEIERELTAITEQKNKILEQSEKDKGEVMKQIDRLNEYLKDKAKIVRNLELISEEQYDSLVGKQPDVDDVDDFEKLDDFENLNGGYIETISRIQSYLFHEKSIVYPKALLENFLALLRTGDLIILSGLSGSGKTQLVKSFAKATGNITHIIPVKPNWTSSEDLLGYYNPMQRSYLSTPFLDALIAAHRDPKRLHLICLDEMNLARVEYYFADFLSVLEERVEAPTISLYSMEEAGHVETEFRLFLDVLLKISEGKDLNRLGDFLEKEEILIQLKQRLGIEDGESILSHHARLRRMINGILSVPPVLTIPSNIRIIGAINIDDTTHYLSPKVLDRAHVLQFQSPLNYWSQVKGEVDKSTKNEKSVRLPASQFLRQDYPEFNPQSGDIVTKTISDWATNYLAPVGIELGVRTIRQTLLYRDQLKDISQEEKIDDLTLNNIVRQKLLPRFSFDGKQSPRGGTEESCSAIIQSFRKEIEKLPDFEPFNCKKELADTIERAEKNDQIFNYWA